MKKIVESAYFKVVLEEVDLTDRKVVNILMEAGAKTDIGESDVDEEADLRLFYRSLSGEAMYLLELFAQLTRRPIRSMGLSRSLDNLLGERARPMYSTKKLSK